jgi:hypothetical protein
VYHDDIDLGTEELLTTGVLEAAESDPSKVPEGARFNAM